MDRGPFSERTDHDESPDALARGAITRAAIARRASGARLLDLTEESPTRAGLAPDPAAIAAALSRPRDAHVHEEPLGLRSAREAVASDWAEQGVIIDPERIVLTASTAEARSFLLALLCDPSDEVLVAGPSAPRFAYLAQLAGVHLEHCPLALEDGRLQLDAVAIYEAISDRTRAIALGAPSAPTGTLLTNDLLEALDACGLPLISDEALARYPLDAWPDAIPTVLGRPGETLRFALSGLSRSAALPQPKLAWIGVAGPDELAAPAMERLERLAEALSTVGTSVQLALPELLELARPARAAIRARCRRNLDALRERTRGAAITVPAIGAGWSACLRVPATRTDEAWALALIDAGVRVSPGSSFGLPADEAWLAISLLPREDDFDEGLDAITREVSAS